MSETVPLARGPYRVEITCPLAFDGPLHVGAGERLSAETDAPLRKGAAGRFYLPGSSVRGVIRDVCEREAALLGVGPEALLRLLGPPRGGRRDESDRQGRLEVLDVEFERVTTQVVDRVRHERNTGTAAPGGKFDLEVAWVSGGALALVYHGDGTSDPELRLIDRAVELLQKGIVAFGAGAGGGLGMVTSDREEKREQVHDRGDPRQLAAFLQQRLGSESVDGASVRKHPIAETAGGIMNAPAPWCWLELVLDIGFDGPMLVAMSRPAERKRLEGEKEPDATWFSDRAGTPWLPGTGLRGAIHAHADRLVNTVDRRDLATTLFGEVHGDDTGQRGLALMGWGSVANSPSSSVVLNHVAIDRLTGFAATGRLFSCEALASPVFRHRLLLRWDAGDEQQAAAAFLMLLCLRELEQRLLGVGSRTTRGYGEIASVKLQRATARWVEHSNGGLTVLSERTTADDLIPALGRLEVVDKMQLAWQHQFPDCTAAGGEA